MTRALIHNRRELENLVTAPRGSGVNLTDMRTQWRQLIREEVEQANNSTFQHAEAEEVRLFGPADNQQTTSRVS